MVNNKNLLILGLIVLLLAGSAISVTGDAYSAQEAMHRFREKQRGLERTISSWRGNFAQNCPYFGQPPSEVERQRVRPHPLDPVVPSDRRCKPDQQLDTNTGACVCKLAGYVQNALGHCVPPRTPVSDPCAMGKNCQICQKKEGTELCKTCFRDSPNCQLCLTKNGQVAKCVECDKRTCCTSKLLSPGAKTCGVFPKEEEPSRIGPEPNKKSHPPLLVSRNEPTKLCYELEMKVSEVKADARPNLGSKDSHAYVCKTCPKDKPCEIELCQGKSCEPCNTSQCQTPFKHFPSFDPCAEGKKCEVCQLNNEGKEVCKVCELVGSSTVCNLCVDGKCEKCEEGRCQICKRTTGCRDFPSTTSKPAIQDPCTKGDCKVCVQRTSLDQKGAFQVEETCRECIKGNCKICVGNDCQPCERKLDGSIVCLKKDPLVNGDPNPDPCEGGNCMVCGKKGVATVCKICKNGSCRICKQGQCTSCAANGECLDCNDHGFCSVFPEPLPALPPATCGKGKPCMMCEQIRGRFECIKCNSDGRCCQTDSLQKQCIPCKGSEGNRCPNAPLKPVCEGKKLCKDCYTNSKGLFLCRKCVNQECTIEGAPGRRPKRCGKHCMENFPEIDPDEEDDIPEPPTPGNNPNDSHPPRDYDPTKGKRRPRQPTPGQPPVFDPSRPVGPQNQKPLNDPRYPYDPRLPEGPNNRAPYDPKNPYDPSKPEGPTNRRPFDPRHPWNPLQPEGPENRQPYDTRKPYDPTRPEDFDNRRPYDPKDPQPYDPTLPEGPKNRKPHDPRKPWNPMLPEGPENRKPFDPRHPYDPSRPEDFLNRRPYNPRSPYDPSRPESPTNSRPYDPRDTSNKRPGEFDPTRPVGPNNVLPPNDPRYPYNPNEPEGPTNRKPFNPREPYERSEER